MELEFKYHPIIEGLRVAEDGSVIELKGTILKLHTTGNPSSTRVNFHSKTHSVIKLVCEAWNGLRENTGQRAVRIDGDKNNNHYTNLKWASSTTAKLSESDKKEIIDYLKQGITPSELARKYNVSVTHISRIKKLNEKSN